MSRFKVFFNKLRFLYEQVSGVRFGFFSGSFIGVFSVFFFLEMLLLLGFSGEDSFAITKVLEGVLLPCILSVRVLGILYRSVGGAE